MDTLSPADVRQLASRSASDGEFCVSIYLPTHHKGRETWQDRVRLKNLMKEADEKLTAAGMRSSETRDMLQAASQLVDDSEFWRHQADGLVVLIDRSGTTKYRVPINFSELVVVGRRFHLKPLFPMFVGDGLFYIIAASQGDVRLLRCTRHSFEEIDSAFLPEGSDVITRYVEEHKALQWHTQTGFSPKGSRAAVFHGQGAPASHDKDRIFEYFRLVVEGVNRLIQPIAPPSEEPGRMWSPPPVVFAGVDYLFPIFRDANNGSLNLQPDSVAGSPDEYHTSSAALHEAAWGVVEPYFDQVRQKSADLYRQAKGVAPHRASNELDDVLRAAHDGRIGLSFTASEATRWGRYDPATGQSEFHMQHDPSNGGEELLDAVSVQTFIHGGRAFVVPRVEMPDHSDVAAVMRF